jgi:hypothetical protein
MREGQQELQQALTDNASVQYKSVIGAAFFRYFGMNTT